MDGVRKSSQQGSKPGGQARRLQRPAVEDTVLVSHAETALHLVQPLISRIEKHGLRIWLDAKLSDPGDSLHSDRAARIARSDVLVIVLSSRCDPHAWMELEAAAALAAGVPVLVFLESPEIAWPGTSVPTLVSHEPERIAGFLQRSRVDAMSIWEFAMNFFTNRPTSRLFRRSSETAWRWERNDIDMQADEFGLSLIEEEEPATRSAQLCMVEARVQDGQTVLYFGSSDWKRYRLAWSADIRAVIPAPAWPGAPAIGFMHCDFDSGREWVRAGDPPVEIRLLGREVYGWHMSEYFWKAFVGSLPGILGRPHAGDESD